MRWQGSEQAEMKSKKGDEVKDVSLPHGVNDFFFLFNWQLTVFGNKLSSHFYCLAITQFLFLKSFLLKKFFLCG